MISEMECFTEKTPLVWSIEIDDREYYVFKNISIEIYFFKISKEWEILRKVNKFIFRETQLGD